MKEQTEAVVHPVEVWYRVTYSRHYYPPLREMTVQRTDIKNEPIVKKNMNRLINQGAYAGITLSLSIASCIFVVALAAYTGEVHIKNVLSFFGLLFISYMCRVHSYKQKKVREDFWDNKLTEEQLQSKTTAGRITITLLFIAFLALSLSAFHDTQF